MTLTDFLLDRIAEDEAIVARLSEGDGDDWQPQGLAAVGDGDELRLILNISPARVLAECKAKRRIVRRHDFGDGPLCAECGISISRPGSGAFCGTLADIAAVYADHPDYREKWRP